MIQKPSHYFVRGIEDGMIAALKAYDSDAYVQRVRPYKGELDQDELKKESRTALSQLVNSLPLFLVSYAVGWDEDDGTGPILFGEPITRNHRCIFTVLACGSDWRGDAGEKLGVARMISIAQAAIVGRQFTKTEQLEGGGTEEVFLNLDPMMVLPDEKNPEYVVRMSELTAYAIHFTTYFNYLAAEAVPFEPLNIDEIRFGIDVLNQPHETTGLPGVHINEEAS